MTTDTNGQAQEGQTNQSADPSTLTDDQLAEALATASSEEEGEQFEESEDGEEGWEPDDEQESTDETQQMESEESEEQSEEDTEEPEAAGKGSKVEKLQKQLDGVELLLQRRTSELGQLKQWRSNIEQTLAAITKKLEDGDVTSKAEEIELQNQLLEGRQELRQAKAQEARTEIATRTQQALMTHELADVPVEAMAKVLESDGIPAEYVQQFRQDPLSFDSSPASMVQLAARARDRHYAVQVFQYAKQLEVRNAELEKQVSTKPRQMLGKIQQALRQPPTVTAARGRSASRDAIANTDPSKMTDEELAESISQGYR